VDSLPPLRAKLLARSERIAILRMDGDMYDSTVDILYNLYDLVQVGGFVVIDDYSWGSGAENRNTESQSLFGAKDALLDFRVIHGIEDAAHAMHDIDGGGAWFRKMREVPLMRERYLRTLSNKESMRTALMPDPPRTRKQVNQLEAMWSRNESTEMATWRSELNLREVLVERGCIAKPKASSRGQRG